MTQVASRTAHFLLAASLLAGSLLALDPAAASAQPTDIPSPDAPPPDAEPTPEPLPADAADPEAPPAAAPDPEPLPATPEEAAPEPAPEAGAPAEEGVADDTEHYAEMSLEELLSVQIVEAASRREQSIHDAPSSVSLLTYEQIEAMRGLNPAHPFRRLLGVHVVHWSNAAYRLSVRTFGAQGNLELVLVDGRNVVEQQSGVSPWTWMPFSAEEMERAEVIRGPGSTLYGANAIGGVISIRTRRPIDHPGFEGRVRAGAFYLPASDAVDGDSYALQTVGYGYAAYNYANDDRTIGARFSLGARSGSDPVNPFTGADQHGPGTYYVSGAFQYRPTENAELFATTSHSSAEYFDPGAGDANTRPVHQREQAVTINYNHTGLVDDMIAIRANADFTRQDRTSDVSAESLVYHALVQGDLRLWEGRNVLTVGGDFTHVSNDVSGLSPTFTTLSLVLQDELRLFDDRFVISLASRFDRIGYTSELPGVTDEVDVTYRYANPRGSLIYKFLEGHDVRLTVARGFRTPTPIESAIGAFFLPTTPDDPTRAVVIPSPDLAPTEAQMIEFGYRGDLIDRLRIEAVIALTRIKNPAELRLPLSLPLVFVNGDDVDTIRGEIGGTVVLAPGSEAWVNYVAVRDLSDAQPRHRVSFGAAGRFRGGWFLQGDVEALPSFTTTSLSTAGGSPILAQTRVSVPYMLDVNVRTGRRILDDKVEIFLEGWNLAAFWRDQNDLLRNRFPFASPIGATVLAGVGLRTE